MCSGSAATLPAKLSTEMPFEMPYSVIISPIHMRKIDPPTATMMAVRNARCEEAVKIPCFSSTSRRLNDWSIASGTARMRPYCANFLRPASPSSWLSALSEGDIIVRSCMMIEAVMYGPTPSMTIERFDRPPPEKMFRMPKNWLLARNCWSAPALTPGTGIVAISRKAAKRPIITRMRFLSGRSFQIILIFWKKVFMVFCA